MRGCCSEHPKWALDALKAKGYVILKFSNEEQARLNDLCHYSRKFFSNPSAYKEGFKCFPIPGGYMTPFPGTYEIFELRRGLPGCPAELRQAMEAFAVLEKLALDFATQIGCDIGVDLQQMPSDTSSTMRCIHYDRPLESRGAADLPKVTGQHIAVGAEVRLVNLQGGEVALNGLKGTVTGMDEGFEVSLAGAPEAILSARGSKSITVGMDKLRMLRPDCPGMYPAHTDSSLITVAPKSSAPGLEVKDLQTGEWFNVEDLLNDGEALLFVGDPLDYASGHRYPALMHRPAVCRGSSAASSMEHRISTPFFLYPRADAVLAPGWLPRLVFEDLNGNVNKCRDRFPWKKHTCYYSDLVYSEQKDASP